MSILAIKIIKCEICGQVFERIGTRQKYCKPCAEWKKKADASQKCKEYRRKRKIREALGIHKKSEPDINVCDDKKCRLCKYCFRPNSSTTVMCQYIDIVGHSRGCPAGKCSKYERRKK